jgi:hypothetical protein
MVVIPTRALTCAEYEVTGNAHAFRATSEATRDFVVCMVINIPSTVPLGGRASLFGF